METAPKPVLIGKRASVSVAKLAYFEGDFERCLEICSDIAVRTVTAASEVALLTARAYLRTGRPREAQRALVETLETHVTVDASLTAQMLLATARIWQDDVDGGIAMLTTAADRSAGAHFAIRSEIAFCTALGHWAKRDIEAAEAYLALVDPRSDIIHARALEVQAFCHAARGEYQRSADFFRSTLLRLDECMAQDRAIAASAISTLAIYAAELFDRDIARFVEVRAQCIEWSSGLREQHFTTLLHQALFAEVAGDTAAAYEFAARAREAAPTVGFEVFAWGISSQIAFNAGEPHFAMTCVNRAQQLLDSPESRKLSGEERFSVLAVAASWAPFNADKAAELLARYWRLAPAEKLLALAGDPRLTAEETFIDGVIALARDERERARACFRKAFATFRDIGYVTRALTVAHALLGVEDDDDLRLYIGTHTKGTTNHITRSLARPIADRIASLERHPIFSSLSRTQQEVVMLICMGKTNKEIAAWRQVGTQTVKNLLTQSVFPAFGVSSRAELVGTFLRKYADRDEPAYARLQH